MENDRTFRDNHGIEWHVTEVPLASGDTNPWLSFEAGSMERRLFPFPANWHHSTIQRLEQMCRIATPIQREQSAIASHAMRVSPDTAGSADLPVEEGFAAPGTPSDHVSLLTDRWPTREPRVTFRG